MTTHTHATREEWLAARDQLLGREKEHTRMADELARQRRELPWLRLEKEYTLQTADGPRTLAELFDGRSQLVVYHFMFGPDYEHGCPVCSSIADSFNGVLEQLKARDVTMIVHLAGAGGEAGGRARAPGLELHLGVELSRATSTPTSSIREPARRRVSGYPMPPRSSGRTPLTAGPTRPATWRSARA